MEIKPDSLSFSLSEARWVVGQFSLPQDFRRTVERERRAVLASAVSVDLTVAPELGKDIGSGSFQRMWNHSMAQIEMRDAEEEYPRNDDGSEQHVIEIARSNGLTNTLYNCASINYAVAREQATGEDNEDQQRSAMTLELDEQTQTDLNILSESLEELRIATFDFPHYLGQMQSAASIMAAIEQAKAQDE